MKYILFVTLLLCTYFLLNILLFAEKRLVKILLNTVIIFLGIYLTASVILLWLDVFSVKRGLFICLGCAGILLCFNYKKIRKIKDYLSKINFNIHSEIILLVFFACMLLFISGKSEDIRANSDMGVYFQRAATLMSADSKKTQDISEFGYDISDKVEENLLDLQKVHSGLILQETNTQFEYHSLPTWTSLMALTGKMFGISNAAQILSLLYFVSVSSLYFLIENIAPVKRNKYFALALFGSTPIIVYLAKCTFTELAYVAILLAAMYFLSEKNEKMKIIGGYWMGLLGFIHISHFMYLPILFIALFMLSRYRNDKYLAIANCIQCMMFSFSLAYCLTLSPSYTSAQLARLSGRVNTAHIILFLCFCVYLAIGVQLLFLKRKGLCYKYCDKIIAFFEKWGYRLVPLWVIILLILSVIQGYLLGYTDYYKVGGGTWHLRSGYINQGLSGAIHVNLVSIVMATSYIVLPAIFFLMFRSYKKVHVEIKLLAVMLLYALTIYTTFQIDTPTNYYVSRYYAVFIVPIAVILLSKLVVRKRVFAIIGLIGILTAAPYDLLLSDAQAFQGQYEILNDAREIIPANSVVFIQNSQDDYGLNVILTNNLRTLDHVLMYSLDSFEELKDQFVDRHMFIISEEKFDNNGNLKLKKDYTLYGNISSGGVAYPTSLSPVTVKTMYIYEIR